MARNKTEASDISVEEFLNAVVPARRQDDGRDLLSLFQEVTGFKPRMWGGSIIGFGRYHYIYESGREGEFLATGFSPRKTSLSIYIMPGYADFSEILERLGKHKMGKSCLYINKMADINREVLGELIDAGLKNLNRRWTVQPI